MTTGSQHWKQETIAIHGGQEPDPATGSRAVPIYQTTSFVFKDTEHAANLFDLKEPGNIYTRIGNPTTAVWENRLAALDNGVAGLGTSSGMAAIFLAIHTIASAGDHLVSSASLYGGTDTLFRFTLPRIGIECSFVPQPTPEKIAAAIQENTKAVYIETIGNPGCDTPDIAAIAKVAKKHQVPMIVDNTFAPGLCRPLDHGANIVVYSCTKWIGGHGTSIGGMIVDGGNFDWSCGRFADFTEPDPSYHGLSYWEAVGPKSPSGNIAFCVKARVQGMRNIGLCPSPFNAFLFLQGLETLPFRMEVHCRNAMALAEFLSEHRAVSWVCYPGLTDHPTHALSCRYLKGGFGAIVGFGLRGGSAAGQEFINSVELCSHLANVGDAKTLVLHPASTTHRQLNEKQQLAAGITSDFVRVSVGLENIEDILADVDQALHKAGGRD